MLRSGAGWCAILLLACAAQAAPVYRGPIVLPEAFVTPEGRLEIGRYEMEVTGVGGNYVLTFLQGQRKKLSVTGRPRRPDEEAPKGRVPLVGAHFLRSSEDPLPTGQERQFSKTGAAQYEEEKRDWKAVMRVYKSGDGNDAWFVLKERRDAGAWNTVEFQLALAQK